MTHETGPDHARRPWSSMFELHDLAIALAMATRLPVPVDHDRAAERLAASAWASPLIGVLIGAVGASVFVLFQLFGASSSTAAWFAIGAQLIATGALHEDGLADAADGLGAGGEPDRIRQIMRDSRIGAYGAAALIIALGARAAAVGDVATGYGAFALFIASGAASRSIMVLIWTLAPVEPGRQDGLAARAGRPGREAALAACGIGVVLALALVWSWAALWALILASVLSAMFAYYALTRTERLSGDFLGASQVIAEIILLAILASALAA